MKFKKKATVCDLIEFQAGGPLPPDVEVRIPHGGSSFEVWNALHGSWIKLDPGDYINIPTPGDYYPIKASIVAINYQQVK